jgi:cation diffusion facilitator CzcD-associated flavoprotein CzcO
VNPTTPDTPVSPATAREIAIGWITRFDRALAADDPTALRSILVAEPHWRDLVAFTWGVTQTIGADAVADALIAARIAVGARSFTLAPSRRAPRLVRRGGVHVLEAFFDFETDAGRGTGIVRIPESEVDGEADGAEPRAWGLFTSLQSLWTTPDRSETQSYGAHFDRENVRQSWLEQREQRARYEDREPEIAIIGGGHSGLTLAARLAELGRDAVIIERFPRIGDSWRTRYNSLTLHTKSYMSHLPYIPFPPTFPDYIAKDKLAYWLESYAENLDLTCWTSTEFTGGTYDEAASRWYATLRMPDGSQRVVRPRHIVMATGGLGSTPNMPELPGLSSFAGSVVHSTEYQSGDDYEGQSVLVVGAATSAHDIIYDLRGRDCLVTMMQRSPTIVVSLHSAHLPFSQFDATTPAEDADLIGAANFVAPIQTATFVEATIAGREYDRELLDKLEKAGMTVEFGPGDTGYLLKSFREGGGYYINVGGSDLIAAGRVPVLQYADFETFTPTGLQMQDGSTLEFDSIIMATGYLNQQTHVRKLFGDQIADRIGPVFRLSDDTGEYTNSWMPTAQRGLWFMNGGLGQSRTYSRYLALQLAAALDGVNPAAR